MANKVINMTFGAKGDGALAVLKSIGQAADNAKKHLSEMQNSGRPSSNDDVVNSLKSNFGAKSDLGQLGKALKGGGVVLGLRLIASEITKASDQARVLKLNIDAGTMSGTQIGVGVAKAVPIFGELVNASQSLSDAMAAAGEKSGAQWLRHLFQADDAAYLLKLPQIIALTKDADEAVTASLQKQKEVLKSIAEDRRKLSQETIKAGLTGDSAKSYEVKIAGENRLAEIQKRRQTDLEAAHAREQAAEVKARAASAGMDPAAAFAIEKGVYATAAAERKNIADAYDKEATDAKKLNDAEQLALEKEHAKAMAESAASSLKEIGDIQFAGRQRNLRSLGDQLHAELEAVAHNAADKKQAIADALTEHLDGASDADAVTFKKQAAEESAAVDAAAAEDAEAIQRQHNEKMATLERDGANELQNLRANAQAERLRSLGDSLGAELLTIQKNADDKKAAIAKALQQQLKDAGGADADALRQLAADQTDAIDAGAKSEAQTARKKQQLEAVKVLQDGLLATLRAEADGGDEAAAAELKRLETAKANVDEQQKLLELLKQQLQPQQRAAALAELQALKMAGQADVAKQLRDQSIDTLKAQAENGTGQERIDAKRKLEVDKLKKAYESAQARAYSIINDPAAKAEDKAAALASLKSFTSTLGKRYDNDLTGGTQTKRTADLQERGLLITGVAAAARAQTDPAQTTAKASTDAVKLQSAIDKTLAEFVTWSKSQAAKNPVVVFGVSD